MSIRRAGEALAQDQRGATAVEYGVIVALIVLAMIGALSRVANANTGMWNSVANNVTSNS